MRFKPRPAYPEWERIFALVPHFCSDTKEYVWLEFVYRSLCSGYWDSYYYYAYRSEHP